MKTAPVETKANDQKKQSSETKTNKNHAQNRPSSETEQQRVANGQGFILDRLCVNSWPFRARRAGMRARPELEIA